MGKLASSSMPARPALAMTQEQVLPHARAHCTVLPRLGCKPFKSPCWGCCAASNWLGAKARRFKLLQRPASLRKSNDRNQGDMLSRLSVRRCFHHITLVSIQPLANLSICRHLACLCCHESFVPLAAGPALPGSLDCIGAVACCCRHCKPVFSCTLRIALPPPQAARWKEAALHNPG